MSTDTGFSKHPHQCHISSRALQPVIKDENHCCQTVWIQVWPDQLAGHIHHVGRCLDQKLVILPKWFKLYITLTNPTTSSHIKGLHSTWSQISDRFSHIEAHIISTAMAESSKLHGRCYRNIYIFGDFIIV